MRPRTRRLDASSDTIHAAQLPHASLQPGRLTMPSARTRKELQALHAELAETTGADAAPKPRRTRATKSAATPEPAAPAADAPDEAAATPDGAPPSTLAELQALVRDLQDAVHDATETAEEAVAAHPTAALASAFLLGVLVGRAWR